MTSNGCQLTSNPSKALLVGSREGPVVEEIQQGSRGDAAGHRHRWRRTTSGAPGSPRPSPVRHHGGRRPHPSAASTSTSATGSSSSPRRSSPRREAAAELLSEVRTEKGLNAALDSYLSAEHRDAATPTCPMAALGSEAARATGETRAAAAEVIEEMIETLAEDSCFPRCPWRSHGRLRHHDRRHHLGSDRIGDLSRTEILDRARSACTR